MQDVEVGHHDWCDCCVEEMMELAEELSSMELPMASLSDSDLLLSLESLLLLLLKSLLWLVLMLVSMQSLSQ